MQPGQCAPLSNPCGVDWVAQDGFTLCNEPAGLTINTVRRRGVVTREICADAAIAPLFNQSVGFLYSQVDDFGEGAITVTVGSTPMSIAASASPSTIASGGSSQLDVAVTGGNGPFTYSWTPAGTLSNATVQNPIASPSATTTYTVTVTDANGQTATDAVTVSTTSALTVTANPQTISVGGTTQLTALYTGGPAPFTYRWTPASSLSNPNIRTPLAAPAATTTFTVVVTDGNGTITSGSVTVTVNLFLNASANPSVITPGGTSQLVANAAGGLPPYTYTWTDPNGSLSATNIANPTATPSATTTYGVTVTDSAGQSATRSVTVTVNGATLSACFTTTPSQPQTNTAFTIDMSCSSGAITNFTMWLNYAPGAPPTYSGTLPRYTTITEVPTTFAVRVQVTDAAGQTSFVEGPVVVQ